jgi:hypothetical protein
MKEYCISYKTEAEVEVKVKTQEKLIKELIHVRENLLQQADLYTK